MTKTVIIALWPTSCPGLEFVGRVVQGAAYPKSYSSRAKAEQAALDAGDGWGVFKPSWSRTWYVARAQ